MFVGDWRHLNSEFGNLWGRYRGLFLFCFFGILCDGLSTAYFMQRLGPEFESHILFRMAGNLFGPVMGPLFGVWGKIAACGVVAVLCKKFTLYILIAVTLISFYAAWYNVWGTDIHFYEAMNTVTWPIPG